MIVHGDNEGNKNCRVFNETNGHLQYLETWITNHFSLQLTESDNNSYRYDGETKLIREGHKKSQRTVFLYSVI